MFVGIRVSFSKPGSDEVNLGPTPGMAPIPGTHKEKFLPCYT